MKQVTHGLVIAYDSMYVDDIVVWIYTSYIYIILQGLPMVTCVHLWRLAIWWHMAFKH
jgi:hypothetical protein